jgi:hypothetical protein
MLQDSRVKRLLEQEVGGDEVSGDGDTLTGKALEHNRRSAHSGHILPDP